jgi:beta-glucanase (GH16 family)
MFQENNLRWYGQMNLVWMELSAQKIGIIRLNYHWAVVRTMAKYNTDQTENSIVENGVLSIIERNESFIDRGVTKQYTSARFNPKFAFTYGKVEVRAKLPIGLGTWLDIWILLFVNSISNSRRTIPIYEEKEKFLIVTHS